MIIQFHTPQGIVVIDPEAVTDPELAALGLSRQWLNDDYGDFLRAKELLANPPTAITQTEIWELMRIFGRLLLP